MSNTTNGARPRAAVTGASSGIGAAFARKLARDGYDLVLIARSAERLDALAEELKREGAMAAVLAADLADPAGLRSVERKLAGLEPLELLVNNAGFGTVGRFAALDPDEEEREIRLNVVALSRLCRAVLPNMVAAGKGAIINVSSMAGFIPGPFTATYNATKAFVNSFTESLAEEVRGTGVKLQALCPGFTRTEFQERAKVDASQIPAVAWMSAEAVVEASLGALGNGKVFFIPGLGNQVMMAASAAVPRPLLRLIIGRAARRL